jgi:hypothetical protein
MADKSIRTFQKRMAKRGLTVETNVDIAMKKVAMAVGEQLVKTTPVLTGAARGGWVAGSSFGGGSTGLDKGGSFTVAMNRARIARTTPNTTIVIVNNVDHIGLLNDGHSKQQPAGFVQRAIKTGNRRFATLPSIWSKQSL